MTSQVVGYRRIKRQTHENLGMQPLAYPPFAVETSAYWLEVLPAAQAELERAGLWYDSINDYGPNWAEQRARVRVARSPSLHPLRRARAGWDASTTSTTWCRSASSATCVA